MVVAEGGLGLELGLMGGDGAVPSTDAASPGSTEPRNLVFAPAGKPSEAISAAAVCRSPGVVGVPRPTGVPALGVPPPGVPLPTIPAGVYSSSPAPDPSRDTGEGGSAGLLTPAEGADPGLVAAGGGEELMPRRNDGAPGIEGAAVVTTGELRSIGVGVAGRKFGCDKPRAKGFPLAKKAAGRLLPLEGCDGSTSGLGDAGALVRGLLKAAEEKPEPDRL